MGTEAWEDWTACVCSLGQCVRKCKRNKGVRGGHGRGFITLDKARKQQVQVAALDVKSLVFWSLRWGSSTHYNMATSHTEPESYFFYFFGFQKLNC